jgi:hypothetical protein
MKEIITLLVKSDFITLVTERFLKLNSLKEGVFLHLKIYKVISGFVMMVSTESVKKAGLNIKLIKITLK